MGTAARVWLAGYAVAITAGLALLRLTWVWVSLRLNLNRRRRAGARMEKPSWRLLLATSLAGVRGAITAAGILTLPLLMQDGSPFPARSLAIFLAAAVILLSLVGASIGLPTLLKGLDVPVESVGSSKDHARAAAARAAIEAIKQAQHELLEHAGPDKTDVCAGAASRVIAGYQRRVQEHASNDSDARQLRKADAVERKLRLAAPHAEREEVLDLRRHHKIGDETSRKLIHEIDLVESRYR